MPQPGAKKFEKFLATQNAKHFVVIEPVAD